MSWRGKPRWLVLLAALGGCQEQTPTVPITVSEVAPAKPVATNSDTSVTEVAASTPSPTAAETPPKDPAPTEPTEAPFEPPFGHRVELFVPPQQDTGPVERTPRSEESFPEVVLKGFVSVGAPRAVLVIDGAVATLGEGQEKHGIRLLAIDPPQITLERGRRRWTLTLVKSVPAGQRGVREPETQTDVAPIEATNAAKSDAESAAETSAESSPEPAPSADE